MSEFLCYLYFNKSFNSQPLSYWLRLVYQLICTSDMVEHLSRSNIKQNLCFMSDYRKHDFFTLDCTLQQLVRVVYSSSQLCWEFTRDYLHSTSCSAVPNDEPLHKHVIFESKYTVYVNSCFMSSRSDLICTGSVETFKKRRQL